MAKKYVPIRDMTDKQLAKEIADTAWVKNAAENTSLQHPMSYDENMTYSHHHSLLAEQKRRRDNNITVRGPDTADCQACAGTGVARPGRQCKQCGGSGEVTLCSNCRRPIPPPIAHFQGGESSHPVHKHCLIVIKRSKDGGI